jgi:hypothetical protein
MFARLKPRKREAVETWLRHYANVRAFETRWIKLFLTICLILPVALGHGVYSASNRNEYQRHKNTASGE